MVEAEQMIRRYEDPLSGEAAAPENGAQPRVQSVARAISILMAIANSPDGLRAMDIAKMLKFSRQVTYHLLHTLVGCRMLARSQNGRYILGLDVAALSAGFTRHLAPPERLAPVVRAVAIETGETAYATGWVNDEIATLVTVEGLNLVKAVASPGYYKHAHARATGKLLLAMASSEVRERYLNRHGLPQVSYNTIIDRHRLEREFVTIREQGYAIEREEFSPGLCCLAVPATDSLATLAVGVSVPKDRFEANFERYRDIIKRHVAQNM